MPLPKLKKFFVSETGFRFCAIDLRISFLALAIVSKKIIQNRQWNSHKWSRFGAISETRGLAIDLWCAYIFLCSHYIYVYTIYITHIDFCCEISRVNGLACIILLKKLILFWVIQFWETAWPASNFSKSVCEAPNSGKWQTLQWFFSKSGFLVVRHLIMVNGMAWFNLFQKVDFW